MRTIKHEGARILVELNQLEGLSEKSSEVPLFLHQVLAEHEVAFDMPLGLPLLGDMSTQLCSYRAANQLVSDHITIPTPRRMRLKD